ncbi:lysozyme inhibitor LprI family protein [Azospirillum sp. TSO35-2]|uniref:lysozyme inhibitor LprI family protein n=1 Tax=Azospirillum sp. TSO35-2 TaxID=716796 RepID=UPI000D61530A|nr:lysozyme inhibitor LprI family protein [Azospirillum sp. TSO35-2]PWC32431.1 hypothetical protein TSO352_17195 [Azospirillum sp. TSO35-2]
MRANFLVSGLLTAGSLLAVLAIHPALADDAPAETPPGCATTASAAEQLLCREPALTKAVADLSAALDALAATTDDTGRAAIDAGQTLWRSRRDEACPVTVADLADAKAAKTRGDCLLRSMKQRTAALEAERLARSKPVADLPLTVSGAAAPRLAPVPQQPLAINRQISMTALVGRWAKADPVDRTVIDDCRTSYLEVGRDLTVHAVDSRLPLFPLDGALAAGGDPQQGVALTRNAPPAAEGTATAEPVSEASVSLRILPADSRGLDRLLLRMAPPATFAAEFVRCR